MKRYVNTDRWDEGWWLKMGNDSKVVLRYLEDKCDCAGFLTLDAEMVAHRCHLENAEVVRGILKGDLARKVVFGKNENIWLRDFVFEQEGTRQLVWGKLKDRGIVKRIKDKLLEFPEAGNYIGIGNGIECHSIALNGIEAHSMALNTIECPSSSLNGISNSNSNSYSSLRSLKDISLRLPGAAAGGFGELLRRVYEPVWEILRAEGANQWIKRDSWINLCRSFPMADPAVVAQLVISDMQNASDGKCPWLFKAAQKHFMNHEEVRLRLQAGKPVAGLTVGGTLPVETMDAKTALEELRKQD